MENCRGSIIERNRKNQEPSYQAMLKIPGAKAIVKTFKERHDAKIFLEEVHAQRAKMADALKRSKSKSVVSLTAGQRSELKEEVWANSWLKETLKLYSESERITDRIKMPLRTIVKFAGDAKLGELDKKWVRDYIAHARKQKTRRKEVYKWATVGDHLKIVAAAMKWHADELGANGVKLPFSVKMFPNNWDVKRTRRLHADEERRCIARFRASTKKSSPHWSRMFRLAINTAARLQELVLAEWSEFDLNRRYWIIPAEHTKCNKERVVPLNKAALRALRVMKLIKSPDSERVFHAITSPKSASNVFAITMKQMGIVGLRFHDLRHEAISRLVLKERHLSVFEIMNMVGHSSIEMLKRYSNLRGDELAAKLID